MLKPRIPVLRRMPSAPVPAPFAELLAARPLRGIDVGAARGVPDHWLPHLAHMQVDAFEPNEAECARLAAGSHPNVRWHATALAGTRGAT